MNNGIELVAIQLAISAISKAGWDSIGGVDKDFGWIGQRFGLGLGWGWLGWKSVGNGLAYEPASVGMKVVCK